MLAPALIESRYYTVTELIQAEERGVGVTTRLIFPFCQTFNHDKEGRGADVQRLQIELEVQTKNPYKSVLFRRHI